jgi:hypothetical protein
MKAELKVFNRDNGFNSSLHRFFYVCGTPVADFCGKQAPSKEFKHP